MTVIFTATITCRGPRFFSFICVTSITDSRLLVRGQIQEIAWPEFWVHYAMQVDCIDPALIGGVAPAHFATVFRVCQFKYHFLPIYILDLCKI